MERKQNRATEGGELVENSLHYVSYCKSVKSGTDLSVMSLATSKYPYVSSVYPIPIRTNAYS
jgi:hypothetical protein